MNDTNRRVSVALGYFDGLHLAHRAVLDAALAGRDRGLTPVVLLFDAPPAEVLTGRAVPRLLADADRDRLLTNRGFALHKIRFAEIRYAATGVSGTGAETAAASQADHSRRAAARISSTHSP